jgi:5-methylcytosine-specific restriction enzyme A
MAGRTSAPIWTRDECVLALDLYFTLSGVPASDSDPDVVRFSESLNVLRLHGVGPPSAHFRNPRGVYMKLVNFGKLESGALGAKLQSNQSRADVQVWREFVRDRARLRVEAARIRGDHGSRP